MSCGLDQETGIRGGMDDDLIPPPPPRPLGPPLHVSIIGGLCATAGLIFLIMALMRTGGGGGQGLQLYGWLCMALVSAFAILASVQFIRGKSVKLLMLALTLGVVVDVLGWVALPLFQANFGDPEQIVTETRPTDPDDPDFVIKPPEERINLNEIALGITFLVIYAIVSLYLMSTPVKKYVHFRSDR
jgi:hypothetical protein